MVDYAKAATELKARLDAKKKRIADLDSFFVFLRGDVGAETQKANVELAALAAPAIFVSAENSDEIANQTIQLTCGDAVATIAQDRTAPSLTATIASESGAKTVTFVIDPSQSPATAQRVSLAPAVEPKRGTQEIAATFVEELIASAP
jgi:hypothetical protein